MTWVKVSGEQQDRVVLGQCSVREKTVDEWNENSASVLGLLDSRRSEIKLKYSCFIPVGSLQKQQPGCAAHT